jgi:hypothetical protein
VGDVAKFNPDQPRDEHGKYAPGGKKDDKTGDLFAIPRGVHDAIHDKLVETQGKDSYLFQPKQNEQQAKDLHTQLMDENNEVLQSITHPEKVALWDYVGTGYRIMNRSLRGDIGEDEKLSLTEMQSVGHIDDLKSAIDKTALKEDTVVYRGMKVKGELKAGNIIEDKGFVSTSTNPREARGFAITSSEGAVAMITLRAGAKAFPVNRDEQEVIVQAGSRFRVTKVTEEPYVQFGQETYRKVIEMEHLS